MAHNNLEVFWTRGFVPSALIMASLVACCLVVIPNPLKGLTARRRRIAAAAAVDDVVGLESEALQVGVSSIG